MLQTASARFVGTLLVIYLALFAALAINPYDRPTWFVENLTIWLIVAFLTVLWFRGIRFSRLAYVLMSVLAMLHTIGGHYTFALVPFGWITDLFGFQRNHFDRISHFGVGFYAFAIIEWLRAKYPDLSKFVLYTYPVLAIATIAMAYEIVEWIYAAQAAPAAGAAYLGSQGDIWDAQKDMLADTLGAITAVGLYAFLHRKAKPAQLPIK
jgi:putative membrane protein